MQEDRRRPVYHDELQPLMKRIEEIVLEVRATMSAIQDPETGMMTRAEIYLRTQLVDERSKRDKHDLDKLREEMENIKKQMLPQWFVGAALGTAGILAGHFWH